MKSGGWNGVLSAKQDVDGWALDCNEIPVSTPVQVGAYPANFQDFWRFWRQNFLEA